MNAMSSMPPGQSRICFTIPRLQRQQLNLANPFVSIYFYSALDQFGLVSHYRDDNSLLWSS